MKSRLSTLIAVAVLVLFAPAGAQATADHLQCYKVKDPQAKAKYAATLDGLTLMSGSPRRVPVAVLPLDLLSSVGAWKTKIG